MSNEPIIVSPQAAALELLARKRARENLIDFTTYTKPGYIADPFHVELAKALEEVESGKNNRLMIFAPPQNGKSELSTRRFPAFALARNPQHKIISASYNAEFAAGFGRNVRDIVESKEFDKLFPHVKIRSDNRSSGEWAIDNGGTYFAVGVGSATTGRSATIFLIDDPIKDRTEADSAVTRQKHWDWYTDVVFTRLQEESAIVLTLTRWHHDDLAGRLLRLQAEGKGKPWKVLRFTALPEALLGPDGEYIVDSEGRVPGDPLGRRPDEPLTPNRFSIETLREKQDVMGERSWSAMYQQRPIALDGGMFRGAWFKVATEMPAKRTKVRAWDLAASSKGDYTVGALMSRCPKGAFYLEDVIRFRGTAHEVEERILKTAQNDGRGVKIVIPEDPGQAGKPIYIEEMILMSDGTSKRLGDIVVGDFVIAKDGKPHAVTHVYEQGDLPCLKISTECGREVISAHDHPFLTPEGWVEASTLDAGTTLALLTKPIVNERLSRTPEEFRLAGYFIGDGAVGRSAKATATGSCHAEFVCHDDVEMNDFRVCVESIGGSVVNRSVKGSFGTKGIQSWLRETEINGYTAYNKHVPKWVFEARSDLIAEFIGAYFACDGTISKTGDEVLFYSVSKNLLEGVRHLLLRLGIASTLKRKNGKYLENRHESWLLRLRQQDDAVARFYRRVPVHHGIKGSRLASSVAIARYRRFDEAYLPDRVLSITDAGILPCRCITVEDEHSFCVNDIVVHNSQALNFTRKLAGFNVKTQRPSGNKEVRATAFAAQAENGNVLLSPVHPWKDALMQELETFPLGSHDDQCLVAGTLVTTICGDTPIEDIEIGDFVLTRKGYRRVLWAGLTGKDVPVSEVALTDGRSFAGTAGHPVFVAGIGFARIDTISDASYLVSCKHDQDNPSTFGSSKGSASDAIPSLSMSITGDISLQDRPTDVRDGTIFIERSGKKPMGQSLMDVTSIMETRTLSTMRSKTSSAFPATTTSGFTHRWGRGLLMQSDPISVESGLSPRSGTAVRLGESGIVKTGSMLSHDGKPSTSSAMTADRSFNQRTSAANDTTELVSAQTHAPQGQDPKKVEHSLTRPVSPVEKTTRVFLEPELALVRVAHVCAGIRSADVYNLTVEGESEFFANGILVHNCDACADAFNALLAPRRATVMEW